MTYVYSAQSLARNSTASRTRWNVTTCTFYRALCNVAASPAQVNHSDKSFGRTVTIPYNISSIAFVFVDCFSSSQLRYGSIFLQEHCSCLCHGTLLKLWHSCFHYNTFVIYVICYFHILHNSLLRVFYYVFIICSDEKKGTIQTE